MSRPIAVVSPWAGASRGGGRGEVGRGVGERWGHVGRHMASPGRVNALRFRLLFCVFPARLPQHARPAHPPRRSPWHPRRRGREARGEEGVRRPQKDHQGVGSGAGAFGSRALCARLAAASSRALEVEGWPEAGLLGFANAARQVARAASGREVAVVCQGRGAEAGQDRRASKQTKSGRPRTSASAGNTSGGRGVPSAPRPSWSARPAIGDDDVASPGLLRTVTRALPRGSRRRPC